MKLVKYCRRPWNAAFDMLTVCGIQWSRTVLERTIDLYKANIYNYLKEN